MMSMKSFSLNFEKYKQKYGKSEGIPFLNILVNRKTIVLNNDT